MQQSSLTLLTEVVAMQGSASTAVAGGHHKVQRGLCRRADAPPVFAAVLHTQTLPDKSLPCSQLTVLTGLMNVQGSPSTKH